MTGFREICNKCRGMIDPDDAARIVSEAKTHPHMKHHLEPRRFAW